MFAAEVTAWGCVVLRHTYWPSYGNIIDTVRRWREEGAPGGATRTQRSESGRCFVNSDQNLKVVTNDQQLVLTVLSAVCTSQRKNLKHSDDLHKTVQRHSTSQSVYSREREAAWICYLRDINAVLIKSVVAVSSNTSR